MVKRRPSDLCKRCGRYSYENDACRVCGHSELLSPSALLRDLAIIFGGVLVFAFIGWFFWP